MSLVSNCLTKDRPFDNQRVDSCSRCVVIGGVGLGVVGVVSFSSAAIFALPRPLRLLANFVFRSTPLGP